MSLADELLADLEFDGGFEEQPLKVERYLYLLEHILCFVSLCF
jgi:hypothetical protein